MIAGRRRSKEGFMQNIRKCFLTYNSGFSTVRIFPSYQVRKGRDALP